jgi:DNA mismatch repair protein MutL
MAIKLLSNDIIAKISAGEVIERPASVVKELIENAIDAGADTITVSIENAGKTLIEVSDNGSGIRSDDLQNAVMRHATSKLNKVDDLFHIRTLGFRGEALAAAGSVSRMSIRSKAREEAHGSQIKVEAGEVIRFQADNIPEGTLIRVEDLFYNVPARFKFLKTDITERKQIDQLLSRYAAAYPQIRWKLTQDGRQVLVTSGNGDQREVLAAIYGLDTAKKMLETNYEVDGLAIHGFISPVALTRSNRNEIIFFVNGRWIQDAHLSAAVVRAYQSLIMVGRFPITSLFISIDPEEIDVNVHPAKAEIRFRSGDKVFSAIHHAVRRTLMMQSPVPDLNEPVRWQTWQETLGSIATASPSSRGDSPSGTPPQPMAFSPSAEPHLSSREPAPLPTQAQILGFPILRWIGQIGGTYVLAEGPDGLYLIDQHAAHERILFEQLLAAQTGKLPVQTLLDPEILHVSPWQVDLMEQNLPTLADLGFVIEPFGPATWRILAIPAIFTKGNPVSAVQSVLEDFEEDEEPLKNELEKRIAARVCKRMAVKAGQTLTAEEQKALIRDLENCANPRTCPHGRPTMIHLSIHLLEQQFGRKGKI